MKKSRSGGRASGQRRRRVDAQRMTKGGVWQTESASFMRRVPACSFKQTQRDGSYRQCIAPRVTPAQQAAGRQQLAQPRRRSAAAQLE